MVDAVERRRRSTVVLKTSDADYWRSYAEVLRRTSTR